MVRHRALGAVLRGGDPSPRAPGLSSDILYGRFRNHPDPSAFNARWHSPTPPHRDVGDRPSTPADGHLEEDRHRAELLDRLIDLRNALHASVSEIARLRRANAALRKDVARLERSGGRASAVAGWKRETHASAHPSRLLIRRYPWSPMKRYHVTTFGCQMNEHDSERMKGMLESLGYAEAPGPRRRRPDPLQHLLDPRDGRQPLRRPPRRGQAAEVRGPGARRRRRRLLGAVGQGRGLRALPVRRRRLRPRPGAPARRVPDLRLAHRPGLLRVRGLHRPPAGQARPRLPGLGADLRSGCNCVCSYCIVPSTRGPRGLARRRPSSSPRSSASPPTACAR